MKEYEILKAKIKELKKQNSILLKETRQYKKELLQTKGNPKSKSIPIRFYLNDKTIRLVKKSIDKLKQIDPISGWFVHILSIFTALATVPFIACYCMSCFLFIFNRKLTFLCHPSQCYPSCYHSITASFCVVTSLISFLSSSRLAAAILDASIAVSIFLSTTSPDLEIACNISAPLTAPLYCCTCCCCLCF